MVVGAGWNGARAFTATSGPGVSLMQEFFGLAYFAEVPVVVVRRAARRPLDRHADPHAAVRPPPLRLRLARRHQARAADPRRPGEAFEFSSLAFDLAERLQTPVFVMLDLDIGMNSHLSRPFQWDEARAYDRGKVLSFDQLEEVAEFGRYKDVDGDGVPYRTLPGAIPRSAPISPAAPAATAMPATPRIPRLCRQHGAAAAQVRDGAKLAPRPVVKLAAEPTRLGVVYYGSTSAAMDEALALLADRGLPADALRIRAFPLGARDRGIRQSPRHVCSSSSRTATRRCAR